mgnify:CR=1 FL=1
MADVRVGIDVVTLSRVRRSLERHKSAFMSKLLTPDEARYCDGPRVVERVAGRIAAKEAIMKVLGRGWPQVAWTDIEVLADPSGRPAVTLRGAAEVLMQSSGITSLDVSITHDGDVAIAVAAGLLSGAWRGS